MLNFYSYFCQFLSITFVVYWHSLSLFLPIIKVVWLESCLLIWISNPDFSKYSKPGPETESSYLRWIKDVTRDEKIGLKRFSKCQCVQFFHIGSFVCSHHDDADTDADPADDVQFGVEHLVDCSRTALTEQMERNRNVSTTGRNWNSFFTMKWFNRMSWCDFMSCISESETPSVTVVMRTSSPSFLGQMSLAASITVPVGPQQSSCEEETRTQRLLVTSG